MEIQDFYCGKIPYVFFQMVADGVHISKKRYWFLISRVLMFFFVAIKFRYFSQVFKLKISKITPSSIVRSSRQLVPKSLTHDGAIN